MSGIGDHRPGGRPDDLLDDATIDALVTGEPVDARLDDLAAFSREARALGDGPPPRPSPALAELIARGGAAAERTTPTAPVSRPRRRTTSVAASLAGLGAVAKVALGASVGVAGVAAAGAAGVLPGSADRPVRDVIEATTPIDFRESDDDRPTQDRPTTTPSQADNGGVPTGEAPGSTSDRGEAPGEPGQSRGRQDPATEPGERGRNPEQPGGQGRNPEQPGDQGRNPEQPGGQGRNPEQPGEPERRAPAATTTTPPADRSQGADPPGQDQERRAPGNSDDKRPEQAEQSE